mgnify:FL=1
MLLLKVLIDSHSASTNLIYLFAAFAITWMIFFIYTLFVSKRLQEVRDEITELHETITRPQNDV